MQNIVIKEGKTEKPTILFRFIACNSSDKSSV